jgi:alkylation response protein AidB-like acyl-CoA dehydrogenase
MDFDLTEEQKILQAAIRDFAEKEIMPVASRTDRDAAFPAAEIKKMAGLGLFGLTIPEKYGGAGKGLTELCIVVEELARASAAIDNLRINLSLAIVPIRSTGRRNKRKIPAAPRPRRKDGLFCPDRG